MKNLDNYIIKNKKVLFRADFNVPFVNGKISDDSRIIAVKVTTSITLTPPSLLTSALSKLSSSNESISSI